jgi:hypothetical protein
MLGWAVLISAALTLLAIGFKVLTVRLEQAAG